MRPLAFQVGNKVFPKVSPAKGIRRFEVRGKLSPRYIESYEIIEELNPITYHLDLPVEKENKCITCFTSPSLEIIPEIQTTPLYPNLLKSLRI